MAGGEAARRRRFERLREFDRSRDEPAWRAGLLAGVDEAGVGPLAGPVVAAAVVLPADFVLPELFDSKRMTRAQRRRAAGLIRREAVALGVARIGPRRIDRINIRRAMLAAHRRALGALAIVPRSVLVDGKLVPRPPRGWSDVRIEAVVGGDARSLAVAAASVVAKTTRDRIMLRLDRLYPQYGFARHKGYATEAHRDALRAHGLSPVHRHAFCGFLAAEELLRRQGTLAFPAGG
jgi:ribonuclease HII